MASIAYTAGPNISLAPAATTSQFIRVNINSSGQAAIAAIGVLGVGITQDYGTTSDRVAVRLFTASGTQIGTASEAIAVGDTIYTAANGKFSKTSGGGAIAAGIAKTAASADGDQFEFVHVRLA